ncbi:MAG TPA: phosphatase PAP2 family protein [Rhizomicrobium sp.]|nr:phosphatase PAP2 family protein [Rhizomicrobium sp.]
MSYNRDEIGITSAASKSAPQLERALVIWSIAAVGTALATALSIWWIDIPVARDFAGNAARLQVLGTGLGSVVLISADLTIALALVFVRLVRGHISELSKASILAALTSITTYAVNDVVVKFAFGMAGPAAFLTQGADHRFHFGHGTFDTSFPSGHMALAASFGVVMMLLQPRTIGVLAPLLSLGAVALVVGDWHFVSDVVAGGFIGFSSGLIASELWAAHGQRIAMSSAPGR